MANKRTRTKPEIVAVIRAVDHVGTVGEMARRLGVLPQHVNNWKKRGAPANVCRAIEEATEGAVTRYDLQPAVFGPAPSQAA